MTHRDTKRSPLILPFRNVHSANWIRGKRCGFQCFLEFRNVSIEVCLEVLCRYSIDSGCPTPFVLTHVGIGS